MNNGATPRGTIRTYLRKKVTPFVPDIVAANSNNNSNMNDVVSPMCEKFTPPTVQLGGSQNDALVEIINFNQPSPVSPISSSRIDFFGTLTSNQSTQDIPVDGQDAIVDDHMLVISQVPTLLFRHDEHDDDAEVRNIMILNSGCSSYVSGRGNDACSSRGSHLWLSSHDDYDTFRSESSSTQFSLPTVDETTDLNEERMEIFTLKPSNSSAFKARDYRSRRLNRSKRSVSEPPVPPAHTSSPIALLRRHTVGVVGTPIKYEYISTKGAGSILLAKCANAMTNVVTCASAHAVQVSAPQLVCSDDGAYGGRARSNEAENHQPAAGFPQMRSLSIDITNDFNYGATPTSRKRERKIAHDDDHTDMDAGLATANICSIGRLDRSRSLSSITSVPKPVRDCAPIQRHSKSKRPNMLEDLVVTAHPDDIIKLVQLVKAADKGGLNLSPSGKSRIYDDGTEKCTRFLSWLNSLGFSEAYWGEAVVYDIAEDSMKALVIALARTTYWQSVEAPRARTRTAFSDLRSKLIPFNIITNPSTIAGMMPDALSVRAPTPSRILADHLSNLTFRGETPLSNNSDRQTPGVGKLHSSPSEEAVAADFES